MAEGEAAAARSEGADGLMAMERRGVADDVDAADELDAINAERLLLREAAIVSSLERGCEACAREKERCLYA